MVAHQYKLYGMSVSTCTQKVVFALKAKNLNFEFININVLKREQKLPEHIARHPFGKIPVLEDETGFMIFESLAIVRYLDAEYPTIGTKLVPTDPKKAAVVDQWTYQSSFNFYPHIQGVIVETAIKPVAKLPTDEAKLAASRALLEPTLDIYERHFATRTFFANDEFSLADVAHLPYFNVINRTQPDLIKTRPNVAAWFKRSTEMDTWKAVMEWVQAAPKSH
ncbi:glutathione transferase [Fimicolochytrium jonesii]|uniref:glutathione transferase n=1 Tax=Fimicolochytrium jonesii TaxID=1396493 RepID=UPI0022FEEB01|nr:glutathione transferase [Fimicolochytrium jonesii]KAI8821263.1 glutathione transferase [Fimicolochytrium jonesii]